MAGGPDMEVGSKSNQALNVQRLQSRFSLRGTDVPSFNLQGQAGEGGLLATFDAIFQQVTPAVTLADGVDNQVQTTGSCQDSACDSDADEALAAGEAKPVKEETSTADVDATNPSGAVLELAAEAVLVSDSKIEAEPEVASASNQKTDAETESKNELDDDAANTAAALTIAGQQQLPAPSSASLNDTPVETDVESPLVEAGSSISQPDSGTKRSGVATQDNAVNQQGTNESLTSASVAGPSDNQSGGVEGSKKTPVSDDPSQASEQNDSDTPQAPRRTRRAERLLDHADKQSAQGSDVPANNDSLSADSKAGSQEQGKANVDSQLLGELQRVEPYELPAGPSDGSFLNGPGSAISNTQPPSNLGPVAVSTSTAPTVIKEFAEQVSDVTAIDGVSETDAVASSDRSSSKRGPRELATESGTTTTSNSSNESRVRLVQRVTRAFQRLGPEGGRVQIMLHPAELGSVRLDLSVDGNRVNATMTADSEAALDVLKENLPELKQRLIESGMVVDRMEVELDQRQSQGDSARFRQDSGQGSSGQQERRWNGAGQGSRRPADVTATKGNASQISPQRIPRGRLDLSI